jgi:hypothetical protein
MNIRGKEEKVIEKLLTEIKCERMVEVGVFRGNLMRTILRSDCSNFIKDYWAVDPWMEKYGDEFYRGVCKYMPWFPQLRVLRLTSVEAAELLNRYIDRYFDFVYIDADHSYEMVKEDILAWRHHIRAGGILAGHDYHRKWPGVIKAVNEIIGVDNIEIRNDIWVERINE